MERWLTINKYINAESSGGGFPGWLQRITGKLRTRAPDYLAATDNYVANVAGVIAKAQITNGGPVILLQPENEYSQGDAGAPSYFPDPVYFKYVEDQYRNAGIVVPFISNDGIHTVSTVIDLANNLKPIHTGISHLTQRSTVPQRVMLIYMDMIRTLFCSIVPTHTPGQLEPFQHTFMNSMRSKVHRHSTLWMSSRVVHLIRGVVLGLTSVLFS